MRHRALSSGLLILVLTMVGVALMADANVDPAFDEDGRVIVPIGPAWDDAQELAIQSDGKIVVLGNCHVGGPNTTFEMCLARFNTDGSLDSTFDGDGKVFKQIDPTTNTFYIGYGIDIQTDGKILIVGYCPAGSTGLCVQRFNGDGSPDTSFGVDGLVSTPFGANTGARDVTVHSDGRIVVLGLCNGLLFCVARYNADGTLDTSFDGDGTVTADITVRPDTPQAIAVQSDGKILAGGYCLNNLNNHDFCLVRFNPDGSFDASFDGDGKTSTGVGAFDDFALDVDVQADGTIVVSGACFIGAANNADFCAARFSDDGRLDTSFGGDGRVDTSFGHYEFAVSMALQADDKVVLAGTCHHGNLRPEDFCLVRYNADGSLDPSFDGDGKAETKVGSFTADSARAIALQADGKLVVAGSCQRFTYAITGVSTDQDFCLVRYGGPAIDSDADSVLDGADECPGTAGGVVDVYGCALAQVDGDADGLCDFGEFSSFCRGGDNCSLVANPGQDNNDGDLAGDPCDPDDDNDTVLDDADNCRLFPNHSQWNADGDSEGDPCDADALLRAEYVFPDPNSPSGEPDGSIWASSGTLTPFPREGVGLDIIDPGDQAARLYYVASPLIARPATTATISALLQTPPVSDASAAWSGDHLGMRLILLDGERKTELAFGRDPATHERQLVLLDAIGAPPLAFPWDNNTHNRIEVHRHANGDVTVLASNGVTGDVVSHTYAASTLPVSGDSPQIVWGAGGSGGGVSRWMHVYADAHSTDSDGDGVPTGADNCPQIANPDQADYGGDGIGDVCDSVVDYPTVVFSSTRAGNAEIFGMRTDGTGVVRLTNDPGVDLEPALSPDGTTVAFIGGRGGKLDLYVMAMDGTGLTRLTDDWAIDGSPAWSPDGSRISFTSTRHGNVDIYVMNADGSAVTRLTSHSAIDASPSWSPDGTKIAFSSSRTGNGDIYVMKADGTSATRMTSHVAIDAFPSWSPDASRIAFASTRSGISDIYSMNADGTGVTKLTPHSAIDSEPAWSSNGRIAFSSTRSGAIDLYAMNADGSGVVKLTDSVAFDISPHW